MIVNEKLIKKLVLVLANTSFDVLIKATVNYLLGYPTENLPRTYRAI